MGTQGEHRPENDKTHSRKTQDMATLVITFGGGAAVRKISNNQEILNSRIQNTVCHAHAHTHKRVGGKDFRNAKRNSLDRWTSEVDED